jgi:hypothetical protein
MPQIVADPLCRPVTTCFRLFSGPGIQQFNYLVLILPCLARALRQEKLRQPRAATACGGASLMPCRMG